MRSRTLTLWIFSSLLLTLGLAKVAFAQSPTLHPTFPLLDENGNNVLQSNGAVSTMQSCGSCHDTQYIAKHSFHAAAGLDKLTSPGQLPQGRAWDSSPGAFGKWNPLTYRYLTAPGETTLDLGTADWLRLLGGRHVGGGPATQSRNGQPLTALKLAPNDPETHVLNPETGQSEAWDWQKSGSIEMNCFLCHTTKPDNQARLTELKAGNFRWVNTAVLSGTNLVTQTAQGWQWNRQAFDAAGKVITSFVKAPTGENCGLCHGTVHTTPDPIITTGCEADQWSTLTSGQIVSPQRLNETGMNLAGKKDLSRVWDIHAQRLVDCVNCHYSVNNPIYYQETNNARPDHLKFDSRRRDISEYLYRPSHQFAKGSNTLSSTRLPEAEASMRRCESCHEVEITHAWLPYPARHLNAISCESCHIPKLYAPALQQVDWTVLETTGEANTTCRGYENQAAAETPADLVRVLITGYEPVLLPRQEADGRTRLSPYNLITSYFWLYGDPPRPVRLQDLKTIYLQGNAYHPEIVTLLDNNNDGHLSQAELRLDTPPKVEAIKAKLVALGLENPQIKGEIQPYGIHHNVINGEWVTKECETCHSEKSRLNQPLELASYQPSGVTPELVAGATVNFNGQIYVGEQGQLLYQPNSMAEGLYVLGHDSSFWANWLGILAILGTVLGVSAHGGLRYWTARQTTSPHPILQKVYMYTAYERFWHWLQAAAIIMLIFTGLIIHLPDSFSMFNFWLAVQIHNIVAFTLLVNAFLAAFYHFASGEIRQYLPEPKGFLSQAIEQSLYYLQGIFKNTPHPFEKSAYKKLNPLQQVTYLVILNILLPLQIVTGILMWGAQRWPTLATSLGGLTLLGPFHSLIAWLFVAFLLGHIYLTTTGHTIFANLKAMIMGWDEVEK